MAALVWPAVSHWCRRLAETLAALVLSKFVVAAVLSLSVGAIAGGLGTEGPNGGGFAAVISGIALLLIAALAPFTLLKLVPVAEAGALAHLESVRHRLTGSCASADARRQPRNGPVGIGRSRFGRWQCDFVSRTGRRRADYGWNSTSERPNR